MKGGEESATGREGIPDEWQIRMCEGTVAQVRSCVAGARHKSRARKTPVESQSDRPKCRNRVRVIGAPFFRGWSEEAGRAPRPQHMIRPCPKSESHERSTSNVPHAQMRKAQTDRP